MENQHRKITGYRELTQEEIDLMNEIKAIGEQLNALCERILEHTTGDVFDGSDPIRWRCLGRDNLQSGLMFLTRAVARPTSF